jgi:hypothetical protein
MTFFIYYIEFLSQIGKRNNIIIIIIFFIKEFKNIKK